MTRLKPALWSLSALLTIALTLTAAEWDWQLPMGVPRPEVPADNPMTPAKVEFGRYLFYDKRMSVNSKTSCGTCHKQELAFTDGRARAEGTMGDLHPRSAMSLVNVAYAPVLTWAHPTLDSLEKQALIPMLGEDPSELGLGGFEKEDEDFVSAIRRDPRYQKMFAEAFPGETQVTMQHVIRAIASFERSIVSMRSPYDRYKWQGEASAISDAAKRGDALFTKAGCVHCHGGWNFSSVKYEGGETKDDGGSLFENTGVEVYQAPNRGLFEKTGNARDVGKFRPPTLRNIAVTDPYMHDGSLATLEEVIDHYAEGGRMFSPGKTPMLQPFHFTESEKDDLIEFLKSLTDSDILRDPRFSDPWTK